jgi:hypothetical protein
MNYAQNLACSLGETLVFWQRSEIPLPGVGEDRPRGLTFLESVEKRRGAFDPPEALKGMELAPLMGGRAINLEDSGALVGVKAEHAA